MTVEWRNSHSDGGQPVTSYVVEKKEHGRRAFHKVGTVSFKSLKRAKAMFQVSSGKTSMLIEDLESDTPYIIRVAAVNKYGIGEFTESRPVSALSILHSFAIIGHYWNTLQSSNNY